MKTPRLHIPPAFLFRRVFLLLAIFAAGTELLARSPAVKSTLPVESYGSTHPQFDEQLARLKARSQAGQIDCIFLGNSQVLYSIDPAVIEESYRKETGKTIRCQNFGLGGMTPLTAAPVARILIKLFNPSILIFGTGILDYSESSLEASHKSIMSSPWVKYQLGVFSIDGWLIDHSVAYRYYLGMDDYLLDGTRFKTNIQDNGYLARGSDHSSMPLQEQVAYFNQILNRPRITDTHTLAFRNLLALNSEQLQIIVLETPVNPAYISADPRIAEILPDFEDMLISETRLKGIPLWQTQELLPIPEDAWFDLVHLNIKGAEYLSAILGRYLGNIKR